MSWHEAKEEDVGDALELERHDKSKDRILFGYVKSRENIGVCMDVIEAKLCYG